MTKAPVKKPGKAPAKSAGQKTAARAASSKKPATVKSTAKHPAKPAAKAPAKPAAKVAAKPAPKAAAKPAAKPAPKAAAKPAPAPVKTAAKAAPVAPAKSAAKPATGKPAAKAAASAKQAAKAAPVVPVKPVWSNKPMAVSAPPTRPLPQPIKPAAAEPKQNQQQNKPMQLKPVPAKVKIDFAAGDHVVYPTHGVGKILRIERQLIAGFELELMVVEFERDKMTVRVPLSKVNSVGIRKLSSPQKMKSALETLKGRARVKRAMWSRRAQEYEAKINSGDPVSIAEVVRDLHRNAGQPDQSYSERQIYESALDRLVRELAAVERIDEDSAGKKLEKILKVA
ncbi:CarD family transcriptional regulator [Ferrovibrio terrae]|uniref:CarD family transcriptional regulator n=1 Tax=Ferrovibrio terrae TaxID=2594003 RepID=UPI0031377368